MEQEGVDMQEVFEKIIEKLESEYEDIKEIYKRTKDMSFYFTFQGVNKAIEIVKKESEKSYHGHFGCNTNGEHEKCNGCGLTDCKNRNKIWFGVSDDNNGWISCNERLPEPIRPVLVTLRNWMNDKYIVRVGRFHTDHWKTDEGIVENSVVVAWQPLPQPYQPKGE